LDNQFYQHLLSQKTIPIQFSSYTTQKHSITSATPNINVSRALTAIKDIFITFDDESVAAATERYICKSCNSFKHPTGNKEDFEFQMTIGSLIFPDFPAKHTSEHWYMTKKALGIQDATFYDVAIDKESYLAVNPDIARRFILDHNLERVISSNMTGLTSKAGDLISLNMKGINHHRTTHAYIHIHYDGILNLRDIGAEVRD